MPGVWEAPFIVDAHEILAVLQAAAEPGRAPQMAAYMKHRFAFLGVGTPERRKLCRPFFRAARGQALDWALRQYARQDPAWVLAFIETHRARMAPLSIREALKHLKG